MKVKVRLPDMGEETEPKATITMWLADVGSRLGEGDDLVEVTTDKAAFCVPCPAGGGVLVERWAAEGDEVKVGDVICVLDV